jgi:hypothetical protein
MSDNQEGRLCIREGRLQDIEAVLELWRQADATPSRRSGPGCNPRAALLRNRSRKRRAPAPFLVGAL